MSGGRAFRASLAKPGEPYWINARGERIAVTRMPTGYLENTIRFLTAKAKTFGSSNQPEAITNRVWLRTLQEEAERRAALRLPYVPETVVLEGDAINWNADSSARVEDEEDDFSFAGDPDIAFAALRKRIVPIPQPPTNPLANRFAALDFTKGKDK